MKVDVFENPVESINGFNLNVELKELTTNGIVNFHLDKEGYSHSFWDGKKLTIPVHGVYKISWGFHQRSINTFYKDLETKLALIINNKAHEEKAKITKETPSFQAVKSTQITLSLLLRENETISLYPEVLKAETPNMKDVFLKVEKVFV